MAATELSVRSTRKARKSKGSQGNGAQQDRRPADDAAGTGEGSESRPRSYAVFGWTLLAGLMFWAALPPLWWWPLAIGGIVPLVMLIQRPEWPTAHPYRQIALASLVHCLLIYQFVRLTHWMAFLGWLALSLYLSAYLPLFVAVSRSLIHRWRVSPLLAVPVVWLGLDWLRGHLFTGFAVGQLAHCFTHRTVMIQIADVIGDYGLSALIALWGACIAYGLGLGLSDSVTRRRQLTAGVVLVVSLGLVIGYGNWRLSAPMVDDGPSARVAIVQGSVDTVFPATEQEADDYWQAIERQYREGTLAALKESDSLDLILWPESKFTRLDVLPPEHDDVATSERSRWERARVELEAYALMVQGKIDQNSIAAWASQRPPDRPITVEEFRSWAVTQTDRFVPMLVGSQASSFDHDHFYNAAIYLNDQGQVTERYFKMHLVMFGEYIPGARLFPFLYQLGPVAGGLTPGDRPTVIQAGGLSFAPSICFETTVPRVIRSQVRQLRAAGREPDVLINLTDDGWFWGSSALDLHLATNVFRAVECRKPMLVSANTGLSAVISGRGRIINQGPRQAEAALLTDVTRESLRSPYLVIGDWPAMTCGWLVVAVIGWSLLSRWRRHDPAKNPSVA